MTLQRPYLPEGFEDFWSHTAAEALESPLAFEREPQSEVSLAGFVIDLVHFRGMQGQRLHGWFSYPESGEASPGFLWLPPYGRRSMLPNEYGTRGGFCSLSLNYFGESAFHVEEYTPSRGYFTEGIESPRTWVFRRVFQDSVVAARVLSVQPEVNPARIAAMGMSQGGGVAVWMGAFIPLVRCAVGDMPFGAARPIVFDRPIHRYPLKEVVDWMEQSSSHRERALETMAFFDTVNVASFCRVPTLVTYGLKDPAVREFEVRSVYEALAGEKAIEAIDGGHDWHPSMVERNAGWLRKSL